MCVRACACTSIFVYTVCMHVYSICMCVYISLGRIPFLTNFFFKHTLSVEYVYYPRKAICTNLSVVCLILFFPFQTSTDMAARPITGQHELHHSSSFLIQFSYA